MDCGRPSLTTRKLKAAYPRWAVLSGYCLDDGGRILNPLRRVSSTTLTSERAVSVGEGRPRFVSVQRPFVPTTSANTGFPTGVDANEHRYAWLGGSSTPPEGGFLTPMSPSTATATRDSTAGGSSMVPRGAQV